MARKNLISGMARKNLISGITRKNLISGITGGSSSSTAVWFLLFFSYRWDLVLTLITARPPCTRLNQFLRLSHKIQL